MIKFSVRQPYCPLPAGDQAGIGAVLTGKPQRHFQTDKETCPIVAIDYVLRSVGSRLYSRRGSRDVTVFQ